jgi:hypothetical protein
MDDIFKLIEEGNKMMFDINVSPKTWVLPNRVKFNHWIDYTFKYDAVSFNNPAIKTRKQLNDEESEEQEKACATKSDGVELFSHQKFIKDYIQYDSPYRGLFVFHNLGTGKCHAKDTPIIMFDGSIKMVQDIVVGDKIMGDDSTARRVLSLTRGRDDLYEIIPTKGEKHVVNADHILCLKLSNKGVSKTKTKNPTYITNTLDKQNKKFKVTHHETEDVARNYLKSLTEEDNILEISVKDYLDKSSSFISNLKLYKKPVEYNAKKVLFDPYILGVWLGDGSQRDPVITNQDATLLNYLRNTLPTYGLQLNYQSGYDYRISSCTSCKNKTGKNAMLNALKQYKMINNKHIPDILKCNSREVRLQVLAGLIDTDGSLNDNCYEIIQENEKLIDDIIYLARSLGFAAYRTVKQGSWTYNGIKKTGTYFRIFISGEGIEHIPVKIERKKASPRKQVKDVLVSGFKVNKIEKGDYYGFTVDKNSRYLLGDFTVTHNSCSAVAASEILLKNMNVTVMLPASLKPNFIDEIKKCGNMFYKLKQHWVFIPKTKFATNIDKVCKLMSLEKKFVVKKEGVWVPTSHKTENFFTLSKETQDHIIEQIDNMIKMRFSFISYNGLTKKAVAEMTEGGRNPFDNQCVIIDEVHNFVSKIVNGRAIGQALYKLILNAKNCKLICLSGTPIINYPNEIAYLINLLCGLRKTYVVKFSKTSSFNIIDIKTELDGSKYIDYFYIDENAKTIYMTFIPDGFKLSGQDLGEVSRDSANYSNEEMLDLTLKTLDTKLGMTFMKKSITESKALPELQEDFNRYFIDFGTNKVNNPKLFMKRVVGTVSFYSTYSPALYPSVTKHEVALPMTDYQFPIYEEARAKEHKKESQSKKTQDGDNPFASSGQVYRFYSRAICNFVFPEDIKRPFPSKMSFTKSEIDIIDDDVETTASITKTQTIKGAERDEYLMELNKALDALATNMHQKTSYLNTNNIEKYSPKFKYICDKIQGLNGNALVYSQFRKVEGLGVLGLVLRANGFAEFKLKKLSNGEWDLDISKEDANKPKFAFFSGNNDESKMLLKIFNSDFETLPEIIRRKLDSHTYETQDKTLTNLHGSLIKVFMITQSGAEGISLKNVRQVHIVEPYWNHVRMDQVVGRAVRTCSHVALPASERHVDVFTYYTSFTNEQLEKSFTLRTKDKGLTTDEYIYRIAKRKAAIIESILALLKKSAVDCGVNSKKHKNITCFGFPSNIDQHEIVFNHDIRDDALDYQYETDIIENEWEGKVLKTKVGNFLINTKTNIVYDYDLYTDSGKLLKLGKLVHGANGKMQIVKHTTYVATHDKSVRRTRK